MAAFERSRALFKYHWYLAINNRSLDFMLVFHLFGVQSRDSRQGGDPLGKTRPDLGALHADDCGTFVLPAQ